jgi:hypothetical protein
MRTVRRTTALERFGGARAFVGREREAIDDHVDRFLAQALRVDFVERSGFAIDVHARVPLPGQCLDGVLRLGAVECHGRVKDHARALRPCRQLVGRRFDGIGRDSHATIGARQSACVGHEKTQVIVNLGDRSYRRTGVLDRVLLLERDGRRNVADAVYVGALHLLEKQASVGRQRLNVTALPLGV